MRLWGKQARTIAGHVFAAVRKYPTLSLLALLLLVSVVPRITGLGQSLGATAQAPLASLALLHHGGDGDTDAQVRRELETTQQELAVTRLALAEARRSLAAHQRLELAVGAAELEAMQVTQARVVLGHDVSPWRRSIVIDRGSQHGVRLGNPVVHGRVLLGRIEAVGPMTSRVQLLTDPGVRGIRIKVLPASVLETGTAALDESELDGLPRGIATGCHRSSFAVQLDFVPLDASLQAGDLVFTSHQSAIVPGGLIVGRIAEVTRSQRREFASVRVEPWGQPSRLEQVEVLDFTIDLDGLVTTR